jgi:hypothetical protein
MTLDQADRPEDGSGTGGTTPSKSVSRVTLLGASLGAAILSGLVAWGVSEVTHQAFRPEVVVQESMLGPLAVPVPESERRTETANATVVYGGLGALLGLTMGAAGGLVRGSKARAVRSAAAGLVVGAVATGALALAIVPRHLDYLDSLDPADTNLVMPMLFHGAVWLGIGLAGGLALGMSQGGRGPAINGVIGGLVGGAIGAGVYEVVAAMAIPGANSAVPLSADRMVRLTALLAVATAVAAFSTATICSGTQPRRSKGPSRIDSGGSS